jgi:hypothetical protein
MKLRIEYFDHNEDFARHLPREGMVVSTPRCADGALTWYLVRLDSSLSYHGKEYSHFLVASRWPAHPVGGEAPRRSLFSWCQTMQRQWPMAFHSGSFSMSRGEWLR